MKNQTRITIERFRKEEKCSSADPRRFERETAYRRQRLRCALCRSRNRRQRRRVAKVEMLSWTSQPFATSITWDLSAFALSRVIMMGGFDFCLFFDPAGPPLGRRVTSPCSLLEPAIRSLESEFSAAAAAEIGRELANPFIIHSILTHERNL
ncbi:hypothetical protein ACP275_02G066300 [Erythranthe tilingii]